MEKELVITFSLIKENSPKYYFLVVTNDGKERTFGHDFLNRNKEMPYPSTIGGYKPRGSFELELIKIIEDIFGSYKKTIPYKQFIYRLEFNTKYTQTGTACLREKVDEFGNFFIPQVRNIVPLKDDHIEFIQDVFAFNQHFNK